IPKTLGQPLMGFLKFSTPTNKRAYGNTEATYPTLKHGSPTSTAGSSMGLPKWATAFHRNSKTTSWMAVASGGRKSPQPYLDPCSTLRKVKKLDVATENTTPPKPISSNLLAHCV